jgi:Domain of unknown function (DUF1707)
MTDLRIGDAERAAAVERLSAHAAAGRLGVDELERRIERAHTAVFASDLLAIEADLPGGAPVRSSRPRLPVAARRPPVAPVALVLAGVALTVIVGHPVVPLFVLAFVLAARRRRVWT